MSLVLRGFFFFLYSTYKWDYTVLSLLPLRSILVTANGNISFFSWLFIILYCIGSTSSLFIYLSMDTWLFSGLHVSFRVTFFVCLFSSDKSPEVELLGHMVILFLIFRGNFILFSIVIVPVYIFTNKAQGFPSLHVLANILCLIFLVKAFVTHVRR